jgi:hypothetical protein
LQITSRLAFPPLRIAPKEAGEVNGEAGRDDEAEHHKAIQVKAFPV